MIQHAAVLSAHPEKLLPAQWHLRWNWEGSLWLTALVVLAGVCWVSIFYLRETSTAGGRMRMLLGMLRLAALSLAMLMLAQPTVEWFRTGRPRLVLLIDRSASMGTLDRYEGTTVDLSRNSVCKKLLLGKDLLLDRWQSEYQLEVIAFDETVDPLVEAQDSLALQVQSLETTKGRGHGTRLGGALDYALYKLPGPPPLAVVVMTDGIVTQGQTLEQAALRARRLRIPLYTIAIGSERRRPDIAVKNLLVEETVFPGDRLQVEATLHATGYKGKQVEVILRDNNRDAGATRQLASTSLRISKNEETQTIRLAIRPEQAGQLALELGVVPLSDERDLENNMVRQVVDVCKDKIRVLLAQSQPSYEYRALKSLLERDPVVDLRVRLQEADADYPAIDDTALRTFPASEKELFAYDVLLLGDVDLGLLPRSVWPLIERFVSVHGGGMVAIAGPQFMPWSYRGVHAIETLLPVTLEPLNPLRQQGTPLRLPINSTETFAINPTAVGWRTPSLQLGETAQDSERIWGDLPPVSWFTRVDNIKPGSQVLAEFLGQTNHQGQHLPAILRHYVGAGEVLFHATDETWRWRWRTDDRYFARYWGQVVRRLGRGRLSAGRQGIQLTSDRSLYLPGDSVELQVRFRNPAQSPAEDDQVVVQLQGAKVPARHIQMQRRLGRRGLFTATVKDLPPSEYEALLLRPHIGGSAETAQFEIKQPPREFTEVAVNQQGLIRAAEISGGKFYTIATAPNITQELPPQRQQVLEEMPPRKLWNHPVLMSLFVATLASEWLLRRRHGML